MGLVKVARLCDVTGELVTVPRGGVSPGRHVLDVSSRLFMQIASFAYIAAAN